MRAIDVARTAGISAQQVRNYVDGLLLPPVQRTDSGYRVFTEAHVLALAAVRALADGHGWPAARTVMRALHGDDLPAALASLDAAHAELDRERTALATVLTAFGTALTDADADVDPDANADPGGHADADAKVAMNRTGHAQGGLQAVGPLRIGQVAAAVGVRTPVLRFWEARGLLRPDRERGTGYRVYGPAETRLAHVVALLRRGHYPLETIDAILGELRTTGNPERVRAELTRREHDVNRRSLRALAAAGALHAYLAHRGVTRSADA
ncbi:MerR family transcriptional regulator [Streptomyces sp. ISL-36]|uniref:MerR family transcriptional regulator n=1 Tax=Streptomyces sp. ISL-36 TaxID=2819182 RepID=UPI001BEAEAAA|nr:MerR family transcriptional regulator [Streptomyces sp. ISL-36]MBT2441766.1 MerR family transcriptional regulator [Streptomyces sp. ISL-36]